LTWINVQIVDARSSTSCSVEQTMRRARTVAVAHLLLVFDRCVDLRY